jgi:hypothetical protein
MGDEQGQGGLTRLVLFLDENHCRNPHMIEVIEEHGAVCEKHLDHFQPGTEDTEWLPHIGRRGWCLVTTDARIRRNTLEKEAVRASGVRMFYFSRNQLSGKEMGAALKRALPQMEELVNVQPAPFTASINKKGDVTLRDTFDIARSEKIEQP